MSAARVENSSILPGSFSPGRCVLRNMLLYMRRICGWNSTPDIVVKLGHAVHFHGVGFEGSRSHSRQLVQVNGRKLTFSKAPISARLLG